MNNVSLADAAKQIETAMLPLQCVATAKEGYVRVWNCYCGSIMGAYNNKLDAVCAELGMKWDRQRTYGNGMISAADWEDRAVFVTKTT